MIKYFCDNCKGLIGEEGRDCYASQYFGDKVRIDVGDPSKETANHYCKSCILAFCKDTLDYHPPEEYKEDK